MFFLEYKKKIRLFFFFLSGIILCILILEISANLRHRNSRNKVDQLFKEASAVTNSNDRYAAVDSMYAISKSIHYRKGILKSYFIRAVISLDSNEVKKCYKRVNDIEPEVIALGDYGFISHLKFLKAICFARFSLYDDAKGEINRALFYADKISDDNERHFRRSKIYYLLVAVLEEQNLSTGPKPLYYLKKAYRESCFVNENDVQRESRAVISTNLASYYLNAKVYDSAQYYFGQAIKLGKITKNKRSLAFSYYRLSLMRYEMKDYHSAIEASLKSVEICKKFNNLLILKDNYIFLAKLYEELKDKKNQNHYLILLTAVNENVDTQNKSSVEAVVTDVTQKKELDNYRDKSTFWMYLAAIGLVIGMLFFIIFFIIKKYNSEKRHKKELMFQIDEKMELLNSYSSDPLSEEGQALKNVTRLAMLNDVSFIIKFNELFPDFRPALLHLEPSLRNSDLKFCSYLKLNFDTKEIARFIGNSVRSVESKKYRLRKKFNLSSMEDLNKWFEKM